MKYLKRVVVIFVLPLIGLSATPVAAALVPGRITERAPRGITRGTKWRIRMGNLALAGGGRVARSAGRERM